MLSVDLVKEIIKANFNRYFKCNDIVDYVIAYRNEISLGDVMNCCLSWDERGSDCSEFDSYKDCGVYKMMVENKVEYDKMGVVERFGFVAVLSEEDG
ncbi:MAG: hypothetical protein CEE42_05180 [Promethearchaeota archaeon Loki_b31]|nr:MAG: hypothetical protein CEE42_05180 [Candidatus Lokiarchaeota archaeon Loki_b31]